MLTVLSPVPRSQLTLQPKWRRLANPNTHYGREIRCKNGNPWDLLLEQVDTWIIDWIEGGVNTLINTVNDFFDNLPWPLDNVGRPIREFCMPNPHQPDKCRWGRWHRSWYQSHFAECENSRLQGGLDMLCYYQRVRACTLIATLL